MTAVLVTFAETLIIPAAAKAVTLRECLMRNNYCRSGCRPSDTRCIDKCDVEHLDCVDEASDVYARPKNPKGRPITGARPQGVMPSGGLLDTTPGFHGQGPAATGGAGINAKPGAPAQIR
ncbi:MAG: hypothetical protein K2Y27_06535 [Xanthobacteraceae bacterium]|nr:hypothetical protein [Xanthobacteraceae bacterium]